MKSHIQMPRCVLKRFENENNELFYFNKNDYEKIAPIKAGHAKTLNRELDYYSDEVEKMLNTSIETPLGRVLNHLDKIDPNSKKISIPTDSEIIIRNYAYSLICRSAQILKALTKNSVYFQFFSKEDQHNIAVVSGMQSAINSDLFKDWHLSFLFNSTDCPFVLPLYGMFSFTDGKCQYLTIPLTTKTSAVLMLGNHLESYLLEREMSIIEVSNENQIFTINQIGCKYEIINNRGICVSNEREYLKRVITSVYEI